MGEERQILSRKVQIIPVGDKEEVKRVYDYIYDGMKAQNLAMNQFISALYATKVMEVSSEDRKELNKLYSRISTSKKGSAYDESITFAKGLPSASSLCQKVKQDFDTACKKGLMYGRVSLPSYRDSNPLLIHNDYIRLRSTNPHTDCGLYHTYESEELFEYELKSGYPEIYIKFANAITFKVIFGNPYKSSALREEFRKIFTSEYQIGSSSIQFHKNEKGRKIILNLALSIPVTKRELDEDSIVGVNLGISCPATCAMNQSYSKVNIGDIDSFLLERLKIQKRLQKLQKDLKFSTSKKHSRKKRLKPIERFHDYEKNYVQTYNHMVSKNVIKFALKNNAKYIHLEDINLDKFTKTGKFLNRNWSYYQLMMYIEYKAKMNNIIVKKISAVTDKCSFCGTDDVVYDSEEMLICKNPKCKMFEETFSVDWNKARLIAQSQEFVSKKKKTKKEIEQLMEEDI